MANLFVLLALASLLLLVVGLISPTLSLFWYKQERTRKKSALIYSLLFIASFILFGVTSDRKGSSSNKSKKSETTVAESKKEEAVKPVKLTDEEYLQKYNQEFDSIKLFKRWEQAPLYGKYADNLNLVLLDMEKQDSLFQIFSNSKIKGLYDKKYKVWEQAVSDYFKFGEPDPDFIYINAACKTALRSYLNDPKFEVVRDKYYLKQTKTGYDYKLQIRGRNRLGASILKEITFSLVYSPTDKMYSVTKIRE